MSATCNAGVSEAGVVRSYVAACLRRTTRTVGLSSKTVALKQRLPYTCRIIGATNRCFIRYGPAEEKEAHSGGNPRRLLG
ncbi:hypothetical protein ElyMa_006309100 [Elysia marginata]|uniref:Uncharacterized protein n=1 Tax=Elysia marginata TaxID=1093978 RepID=A0AAV4HJ91_9GAST|nr:hypothetical protein ElyMa_006309100 [Elysia marginata]